MSSATCRGLTLGTILEKAKLWGDPFEIGQRSSLPFFLSVDLCALLAQTALNMIVGSS